MLLTFTVPTGRIGTGPVGGTWRASFNGSPYTSPLSTAATASDVQQALLTLPSIRACNVTRGLGSFPGLYSWTVTFLAVSDLSIYGYVPVDMYNLGPLVVDDSSVLGTGGAVKVSYVFGTAVDYAPWEGKRAGSYGNDTGSVYTYQR